MSAKKDKEAFYQRLKEELANSTLWPAKYLYKFIVPSQEDKVKKIENIFDNMGAVIETKKSSNGNYTSLSITVTMKNPDAVIEKYHQAAEVEGVISL